MYSINQRRSELTVMKDRFCELDVPEVSRTLSHELFASAAFVVSINRSEMRIIQALLTRSLSLLILFTTCQPCHGVAGDKVR